MASTDVEETPLLAQAKAHETIYDRFSIPRKRAILSLVTICGLMPCALKVHVAVAFETPDHSTVFVSGTFLPCIPQIAKDLNTTGGTVRLVVQERVEGES
jgi:hypothetical protein